MRKPRLKEAQVQAVWLPSGSHGCATIQPHSNSPSNDGKGTSTKVNSCKKINFGSVT